MAVALPTADEVRAGVVTWLRLPNSDTTGKDGETLDLVVQATLSYVRRQPVVVDTPAVDADTAGDVKLACIMLAGRLHRRRNSPGGIEAMTEAGATYVARHDSDVSRLLRLDAYQTPQIG